VVFAVADGARLTDLIRGCPWLMQVLATVRDSRLPNAWVGAGAIRDLVWGQLYGTGFQPEAVRDVDVAFFDSIDLSRERDAEATEILRHTSPEVNWEATNQAAVHTWYAAEFGGEPIAPLTSIEDAVSTWPETATAVAVRLGAADEIQICAPLGLADLMTGVWRRNPRSVSVEQSRTRLARHQPRRRWPRVRVIPPE
jgi:hypothetical protein